MDNKKQCIILIGPMGVGKTTISKKLAKQLGLPYIDCDGMRHKYYAQMPGYNKKYVRQLQKNNEALAYYQYMNPFELMYIEHILNQYPIGIFDFGAGHSVYDIKAHKDKMMVLLRPYQYVYMLRYCGNKEESIQALSRRHRLPYGISSEFYNIINRLYIESNCNIRLAKYIIDTKGKTVQQVVDQIRRQLY